MIRIGIAKHIAKSSGKVRQLGKGYELILGPKKFGYFEFIGSQQTHKTRSVVCLSSLGNIYEISLVPVPVTGKLHLQKKFLTSYLDHLLLQFNINILHETIIP